MALSDEGRAALIYWGVVQHAVESKADTRTLWNAIRESAEAQGFDRPGVSLMGVNEIRSQAALVRNAEVALGNADRAGALQSQHIAEAPWSRPQEERNLNPMLQIRFQHHTISEGMLKTEWRTVVHSGMLPASVNDLFGLVDQSAEQLAADYEVDHAGVGRVTALSV